MALRGVKPELKEKRLKLFLYGPAGVGKTTAALQFPQAYVIDTERGTDFYSATIKKGGGAVFQTTNPDDIKEEIKSLLTEKHPYKTLIIDPVTQIYNALQEKWSRIFEKHAKTEKEAEVQDFGMRYWGRVKSEYKAIQRLLLQLDMNIIITSHQKDIYGNGMQKIGVGPDSMKGDDYVFDLVFRLDKDKDKRIAMTVKERAEIGKGKFPDQFEWSYENFCKYYGKEIIEKESSPIFLASSDQVSEIKRLITVMNVSATEQATWLNKADVETFEELTQDQAGKVLSFLNKKLGGK